MLGQKPGPFPPLRTVDPEGRSWGIEAALSRSVYARQKARELVEQARSVLAFCERECDYSALLIGQARGLRRPGGT